MRFDWPLGLLALLLVPLVVLAYLAIERRRARYAIHYTNIEVLASVTGRSQRWRSYVPPLVALLALIFALAAHRSARGADVGRQRTGVDRADRRHLRLDGGG